MGRGKKKKGGKKNKVSKKPAGKPKVEKLHPDNPPASKAGSQKQDTENPQIEKPADKPKVEKLHPHNPPAGKVGGIIPPAITPSGDRCGTVNCSLVTELRFGRAWPVTPILTLLFFLFPTIPVIKELFSTGSTIKKVGFIDLEVIDNDKVIIAAVLIALFSNIVRLYCSLALMEEIYRRKSPNHKKVLSKSILFVEMLFRFSAVTSLYLAAFFVSSQDIQFEFFVCFCYLLCVVWDIIGLVWPSYWYPWKDNTQWDEISDIWFYIDLVGLVLSTTYVALGTSSLKESSVSFILGLITLGLILIASIEFWLMPKGLYWNLIRKKTTYLEELA